MSIGRTDFPESSWTDMEQSLQRIARELPAETRILPGHGPESTMADELRYSPYLRQ
jgi:glyoxylase-like metal-dependent hydrolase (beta-lactamase superfamily II)